MIFNGIKLIVSLIKELITPVNLGQERKKLLLAKNVKIMNVWFDGLAIIKKEKADLF